VTADVGYEENRRLTAPDGAVDWELPRDEVHVWRASLERPTSVVGELRQTLARDEQQRADRFRFERHRSRYIVGRALLRSLLGAYLGCEPAALEFDYGEFQKPSLPGGPSFNVSHSGSIALFAFTEHGELGVDLELDDPDFAGERIAERFFSSTEVDALQSLPEALRPRAFLTCWTRKEAFIKARGDGLSLALDSFDVTLSPDRPAALLRTHWSDEEPGEWRMEDLSDLKAGYIAAVALRSRVWRVVAREIADTIEGRKPGQEQQ